MNELPHHIEAALMEMGLLSQRELDIDVPDEPKVRWRDVNTVVFDENGEPNF